MQCEESSFDEGCHQETTLHRQVGYVHSFRAEIIEQCLTSDSGGKPLFRSRGYDRENRRKKKLMDREEGGSSNIVGSVPLTLGGQLAAGLQRIVTEEGN